MASSKTEWHFDPNANDEYGVWRKSDSELNYLVAEAMSRDFAAEIVADHGAAEERDQLRADKAELVTALDQMTANFNMARIAMDEESRTLAGELVDEARALLDRHKEG